jgi:hypothetical protein
MNPTSASVLCLLLLSGTATAQGSESLSKFELRGSGGWIGFADESLIHHGLVGASLRISIAGGLGVEPELTYMIGPGSDRDVVFAPVVSWEFGRKRVRPYVLGATGILWHREGSLWGREYIASVGFGVRTQVSPRWSISPEFRMGMWPHLEAKVALGYRF